MKKYFLLILSVSLLVVSCKKDYLDEIPVDFLSSENALVTYDDYNLSVNDLYRLVRTEFYTRDEALPFDYLYSTDLVFDGQASTARHTNLTATFNPTGSITLTHWGALYRIVAQANTVISRAPASQLTDAQKNLVLAKARFFRAFAYRTLAYLYGGVPLTLEEVVSPKTDYVRATKAQVLDVCIEDLNFAVANLSAINLVANGEVNKQAAGHLLAEVYLAAGKYQDAVNASTEVINSGVVNLMRTRFGSRSTVSTGNVYWDLFQPNNQNRKSGNNEGLWVIQMETDVLGGGLTSSSYFPGYALERQHGPSLNLVVSTGSRSPFLWPLDSGGRGVGWAISTRYFSDSIWQSDFNNDIRNAGINFIRSFQANSSASSLFGQTFTDKNPPPGVTVPSRGFFAYQAKATTPGAHPANLVQDAATGLLKSTAGATYLDQYMFRLAETYLIRAEAYLGLDNLANAAADINSIRSRSGATAVTAENVSINYILDERMREFGVEEKRKLTLMRLGLLNDRVKRCNPYYNDMSPTFNLWPIPASEIERNKDAELEQNPGY
jgi:hypothetical protein